MAEFRGIMAGIGDALNDINVITPEFDAAYRKFVVGEDCILNGLTLSEDGTTLTKGVCCGYGYLGKIKNDIQNINAPYIYARFGVFHDSNKPDTFDIVSCNSQEEYIEATTKITTKTITVIANMAQSGIKNSYVCKYSYTAQNANSNIELLNDVPGKKYTQVQEELSQGHYINVNSYFDIVTKTERKKGEPLAWEITITATLKTQYATDPNPPVLARAEFSVQETTQTSIGTEDPIHTPGYYGFLLYKNGECQVPQGKYPQNAVNSETALNLLDGGTIANNVTVEGEIDVADNSDRVATTEFVQKVIEKKINYGLLDGVTNESDRSEKYFSWENAGTFAHHVHISPIIKRKAKMCKGKIYIGAIGYRESDHTQMNILSHTYPAGTVLGTFNLDFAPKEDFTLRVYRGSLADSHVITIRSNGEVVNAEELTIVSTENGVYYSEIYEFGYETN